MRRCLNWGQDNPGGFRFCGACGSPLADKPHHPAGEERKVVTVLFCDLVGFTARSDRADPEDVGAMLRAFRARLRSEIERRRRHPGQAHRGRGHGRVRRSPRSTRTTRSGRCGARCACWTRSPS